MVAEVFWDAILLSLEGFLAVDVVYDVAMGGYYKDGLIEHHRC